ncbi:nudix (nucleoside diphosphate linked moiety X)-type motif 8 [Balamuthia mandrillaris]
MKGRRDTRALLQRLVVGGRTCPSRFASPSFSCSCFFSTASEGAPPPPSWQQSSFSPFPSFTNDVLLSLSERWKQVPKRRLSPAYLKQFTSGPHHQEGKKRPQRRAAVLVPFCNDEQGRAAVLFTKRAASMSLHSGEVSFPGGIVEEGDGGDPIVTALRETREELGFSDRLHNKIRVIGPFHEALSKTGIIVTPVVGFIGDMKEIGAELQPNPGEIDQVFTLSLDQLLDPAHQEMVDWTPPWRGMLQLKSFIAGPDPIWGLTAHILDFVLSELVLPLASPSSSASSSPSS